MDHDAVIEFWFKELSPKEHWVKDPALDKKISLRFGELHRAASLGELWQWRTNTLGRLAEIIVLDQFSRNIYRDQARSFSTDNMALALAQEAILVGADDTLPALQKTFMYLPFMHSESLLIHEQAVLLFAQEGLENNYQFELRHKKIIERFGRYPHRNQILGRASTAHELDFLKEPGSSF